MITQEQLKTLIEYNPETGDVTWLERDKSIIPNDKSRKTWNTRFSGKKINCQGIHGYLVIRIGNKTHLLHRIIWLYVHGEFPECIDHIDGVRNNNRISNLRDVSRAKNNKNVAMNKNNKTGVSGVFFYERVGKFIAYIGANGKRNDLGYFTHLFEAVCARKSAELRYGYHKNHGRK